MSPYFALHAGVLPEWETNKSEQDEIRKALTDIAETGLKSVKAGQSATEVVSTAISSLKSASIGSSYGAAAIDTSGKIATDGSEGSVIYNTGEVAVIGAGAFDTAQLASAIETKGNLEGAVKHLIAEQGRSSPDKDVAIVAIDSKGTFTEQSSGRLFLTAHASESAAPLVHFVDSTIPIFPQHTFLDNGKIIAGLSRYPIAPGQTYILTPGRVGLMSLSSDDFVSYMSTVKKISKAVCKAVGAKYCGLVSTGEDSVTLLPFPKLEIIGAEIPSDELEYYPVFPGYFSSKNGPKMTPEFLKDVYTKVADVTGVAPDGKFDKTFLGSADDKDLMAKLIRGDLPQHRFWEDKGHAAMISPKGKVPGYSIVVPRGHLAPDLFNLPDQDYDALTAASHAAAQALMKGLKVPGCGIFFEGFEGYYAHTKVIPIHPASPEEVPSIEIRGAVPYSDDYQGYMTTQLGPKSKDQSGLSTLADKIRGEVESLRL